MNEPSLADFDVEPSLEDFPSSPAPANDARSSPLSLSPLPLSREERDARMRHLSELLNHPLGLYAGTTFAKYAAAPGTNASRLRDLAHSPLLYKHRLTVPREATAPMRLGTCAHTAILEPHKFLSEYALWDERCENDEEKVAPRRGKKWDAFVAAHPGKTIVRADEHAAAMAMRDAVRAHPAAMRYLRAGNPEVAMWWCDSGTERLCKGRADWITTALGAPCIVGLKSARDCRGGAFGIAAARLGYALHWAFYADGYRAITGEAPRMVEIVVESAAPHDVVVYAIPDEVLEQGRAEYVRLLEILGVCEKTDVWPGASVLEQTLSLPAWAAAAGEDSGEEASAS